MTERIEADVAVVGAGPAGLAAAARAAEAGRNVVVLDESPNPGGQIWKHRPGHGVARGARRWIQRFSRSGARLLTGVQVHFFEEGRTIIAGRESPEEEIVEVRAETIILATGARERFLPFPGWTLPNVFGVGAVQSLLKAGVSFGGKRIIVSGSGPLLLPAAAALSAAGARIVVVAEQAAAREVRRFALGLWRFPGKILQAALYRGQFLSAHYRAGVWVAEASGRARVEEVSLTDGSRFWNESCDILCCGFGLVPNIELAVHLGCKIKGGSVAVDPRQATSVERVFAAGEITGVGGVEQAVVEGQIAGLASSGRPVDGALLSRRAKLQRFAARLEKTFAPRSELRALPDARTIVCRCEDVPCASLDPKWIRRQAKLYTRAGMGPCQGRVCGPAMEFLFGWDFDTVRSPLRPAPLACLLSRHRSNQPAPASERNASE